MPDAFWSVLKDPLTGALTVAALLAVMPVLRHLRKGKSDSSSLITDAWVQRIEERLKQIHELRNVLQEILGKAESALATSRELRAEMARMAAERGPLVERFYRLESEVAGQAVREREHHEAATGARQELSVRLERIAADMDREISDLRRMVNEALARMTRPR